MAIIHEATKEVICKVVYHGTGKCGKTTSLMYMDHHLPKNHRGKFVSLETPTERTLFFDLLPVKTEAGGWKFRFLLYATPGQEYYQASRKLILKGADSIVFVVDSQRERAQDNWDAYELLDKNLKELGQRVEALPMVLQYNKRDINGVLPMEDLERRFNPRTLFSYPSVARTGQGVVEAFLSAARLSMSRFWQKDSQTGMGELFRTSVFTEDDAEHLKKMMGRLVHESGANGALLVDEGTGVISASGDISTTDQETLGALLATNFAAAQELSNGLGSVGFSGLMQRGALWLMRAARVDQRRFLVLVCKRSANRRAIRDAITYFRGPIAEYLKQVDLLSPSRLPRFGELFAHSGSIALAGLEKS